MPNPWERSVASAFLRSAAFFSAAFATAFLVLFFAAGGAPRDQRAENLVTAAYLALVTMAANAAGFAAVTSLSAAWRRLPAARLTLLALAAGLLTYGAYATGLGFALGYALLPIMGTLTAAIRLFFPGILAGLAALGVVFLFRLAPQEPER